VWLARSFVSRALRQAQGDKKHLDICLNMGMIDVTLSLSKGLEREATYHQRTNTLSLLLHTTKFPTI
jgi:hypothetical protein